MRAILFVSLAALFLQGCSYKTWYTGFVEGQKFQGNKLTGNERQSCLDSIIEDYDRYERERQEGLKRKN